MDLNLWAVFYEVACMKNISKTSEKLHISQPAITKQIKNLESYLNCKLFIRSQKGMILTKDGEKIFNDIKQGLNAFELAVISCISCSASPWEGYTPNSWV